MQHLYPVPGTRPFRNDEYLRKVKYRAVERRTLLHLQFKCICVCIFLPVTLPSVPGTCTLTMSFVFFPQVLVASQPPCLNLNVVWLVVAVVAVFSHPI